MNHLPCYCLNLLGSNFIILKLKLALILQSQSPSDLQLSPGDLVKVYVNNEKKNRGK